MDVLRPPLTIPNEGYIYWQINNPKGKKIRCEVIAGEGEGKVSLKKNNDWIGETYTLSKELDYPDTVYINTNRTTISIQAGPDDTLQNIALRFGVIEEDITSNGEKVEGPINGKTLEIPAADRTGNISIQAGSNDTVRSIAVRFGVTEEDITFTSNGEKVKDAPIDGKSLEIPPTLWWLYIEAPPGNQFAVELVAEDELEGEDEIVEHEDPTNP